MEKRDDCPLCAELPEVDTTPALAAHLLTHVRAFRAQLYLAWDRYPGLRGTSGSGFADPVLNRIYQALI